MTKAIFMQGNGKNPHLQGRFFAVSVKGHSGYGEEGSDIVCAGISSALRLAECILSKQLGQEIATSVKEGEVNMAVPDTLQGQDAEVCHMVLSALQEYFDQLSSEYPAHLEVHIIVE